MKMNKDLKNSKYTLRVSTLPALIAANHTHPVETRSLEACGPNLFFFFLLSVFLCPEPENLLPQGDLKNVRDMLLLSVYRPTTRYRTNAQPLESRSPDCGGAYDRKAESITL